MNYYSSIQSHQHLSRNVHMQKMNQHTAYTTRANVLQIKCKDHPGNTTESTDHQHPDHKQTHRTREIHSCLTSAKWSIFAKTERIMGIFTFKNLLGSSCPGPELEPHTRQSTILLLHFGVKTWTVCGPLKTRLKNFVLEHLVYEGLRDPKAFHSAYGYQSLRSARAEAHHHL